MNNFGIPEFKKEIETNPNALKCTKCSCSWFKKETALQIDINFVPVSNQKHTELDSFPVLVCLACNNSFLAPTQFEAKQDAVLKHALKEIELCEKSIKTSE